MKEALENGKELSHSAHANGMNVNIKISILECCNLSEEHT
jgi:hypothetical protein